MSDDRIPLLIARLGTPMQPDQGFREDLFDMLIGEIDFETGRPKNALAPALPVRWRSQPRWRTAVVIALALALLAAIVGAAILSRHPVGLDNLISRSEQAMLQAGPFDVTVAYGGGTVRYQFDRQRLRGVVLTGGRTGRNPGESFVFDGQTYYEYDRGGAFAGAYNTLGAESGRYSRAIGPGAPTHPTGRTWALGAYLLSWPAAGDDLPPALPTCDRFAQLPDETIAGRRAFHVRCDTPVLRGEYWIDQASLMLLETSPAYDSPAIATTVIERPDLTTFDMRIPSDSGRGGELRAGAMLPGTYATYLFPVPLTIDVIPGWVDGIDGPMFGGLRGPNDELIGWNVATTFIDPATGATEPIPATNARDLLDWFASHHPGVIRAGQSVTFDGYAGLEVDVVSTVYPPCQGDPASCPAADSGPWINRGVALDVDGRVVVLGYSARDAAGLAEARAALARIRFQ